MVHTLRAKNCGYKFVRRSSSDVFHGTCSKVLKFVHFNQVTGEPLHRVCVTERLPGDLKLCVKHKDDPVEPKC